MRYTIGAEIIPKENNPNEYVNGLYTWIGYSHVVIDAKSFKEQLETAREIYIPVFDNIEDAQEFAQSLSRYYRKDDCGIGKRRDKIKSKFVRKFYPVKIDSLNFPYKVLKEGKRTFTLKTDRYGKNTDVKKTYPLMLIREK